jgi:hypothetical protein
VRILTPGTWCLWKRCLPAGLLASLVACIALLGCEVTVDNQSTATASQPYPVTAVGIGRMSCLFACQASAPAEVAPSCVPSLRY